MTDVLAVGGWANNAEMIADVAKLGYLDGDVIDLTYGLGNFWTESPRFIVKNDINPERGTGFTEDFRATGWSDDYFDSVVFDPPYKLSGTPALGDFDDAYGISVSTRWQDREVNATAEPLGFKLVDRFDLVTKPRKQPAGRRQVHARRNHSTLLVFEAGR